MKKGLTLGFKMQVEQYQPIEVSVYSEREFEEEISVEEAEIILSKECRENLERVSRDAVAVIQKIKLEIWNDLADEE